MYSIRETFVLQTEIYTFRIFIPSLCCFFFLSLPRWVSVFFPARSTRTCRCHGKWSFFGSSVFLVVKNPYDLRSKIRFWILPKKLKPTRSLWVNVRLRLRLLTGGLSWGTQSVFARGVLSSPLSYRRQIEKRGDPGDEVGHFMWTYIEPLLWDIVIFLEFHSTKQGLPLADSWSRGLD